MKTKRTKTSTGKKKLVKITNETSTGFQPCHVYPQCRAHKCDCYENYLMINTINQYKKESKK